MYSESVSINLSVRAAEQKMRLKKKCFRDMIKKRQVVGWTLKKEMI